MVIFQVLEDLVCSKEEIDQHEVLRQAMTEANEGFCHWKCLTSDNEDMDSKHERLSGQVNELEHKVLILQQEVDRIKKFIGLQSTPTPTKDEGHDMEPVYPGEGHADGPPCPDEVHEDEPACHDGSPQPLRPNPPPCTKEKLLKKLYSFCTRKKTSDGGRSEYVPNINFLTYTSFLLVDVLITC